MYTDLNHKLYMFLKHTISFDTEFNKYIFCDKWANEIDRNYFEEKIKEIKQLFIRFLKVGKNHELILRDLLDMTGDKVNWFSKNKIYTISFIENLKLMYASMDTIPPEQKIIPEFFINYSDEHYEEFEKQFLDINDDLDYFYKLARHAKEFNNYNNPIDFEKVQLMYCFELYKDAVFEIHEYIYKWEMDLPTTDLSKIEFDTITPITNNIKCKTNWNKIDIARLFQLFVETGIFFFDKSNSSQNNILMKKFIENNFTYYSTKFGEQYEIENINKEFSEVNAPINKDKQIEFLNELIKTITDNRDQIRK